VAQEEAFPALLARATGRRVLNAAVSSYGTVREMRLLERIDHRRLAWLIIQYNANDVGENRLFQQRGNVHVGGSREKFETSSRRYEAKRAYYPGKYAWQSVRRLSRAIGASLNPRRPRGPAPTIDEEADAFLNTLLRAGSVDFERVRLVVLEVTGEGAGSRLVPALRQRIARADLPTGIRTAQLIDMNARLGPDDFGVLDDHPNASAHRKIADAILATMGRSP
jgi:lysophospholipase L1-like esterase